MKTIYPRVCPRPRGTGHSLPTRGRGTRRPGAEFEKKKRRGDGDGKIALFVIDSRVVEGRKRVESSKRASRARE